jgi:ribonucleoside-diphosphate reductase alpha chain
VEQQTLNLSANAIRVLEARYLRRDAQRQIVESPEELFERVARAVAQVESPLGYAGEVARWHESFTGCWFRSISCPTARA